MLYSCRKLLLRQNTRNNWKPISRDHIWKLHSRNSCFPAPPPFSLKGTAQLSVFQAGCSNTVRESAPPPSLPLGFFRLSECQRSSVDLVTTDRYICIHVAHLYICSYNICKSARLYSNINICINICILHLFVHNLFITIPTFIPILIGK